MLLYKDSDDSSSEELEGSNWDEEEDSQRSFQMEEQ